MTSLSTALPVSSHLNQGNHEIAEPKVIVDQVIAYEKKQMLEMEKGNSPFVKLLKQDDSFWEKQGVLYLKIEQYIRENFDKIPTWELTGSLHYGMTLRKMEDVIKQKFLDMAAQGKLMTENSLMANLDRTTLYPPNHKGNSDLTRIWGAHFLKSNFPENSKLDVAEHFLIIGDEATELEVEVWHTDYPCLSLIKSGYILSKKIDGENKARDYQYSNVLDALKYRDFTDPGNIIQDANGIGWIVDTERKSFDPPKINKGQYLIREYLKKRFKVLSGDESSSLYQTFKISLSDIGIR